MAHLSITKKQKLIVTLVISICFFLTEITVGFLTHSLALVADAFHYLSDMIGVCISLTAVVISESTRPAPKAYTFGWQRATLLGAFFNGVFLLALGISILVQAIERFVSITKVDKPKLVMIVGCVGFSLNIINILFLHEHDHDHSGHIHNHSGHGDDHPSHSHTHDHVHSDDKEVVTIEMEAHVQPDPANHHEHRHTISLAGNSGRDLGMLGVLMHVVGDAINNLGVIASALIIWLVKDDRKYYADPAIGVFIAIMIVASAVPLTKKSGGILLQIAPGEVDIEDIKHDIEKIPGITSVHELHVWRLNQKKSIASAHIVVDGSTVQSFTEKAKIIMECLHEYGIHSATLQPENSYRSTSDDDDAASTTTAPVRGYAMLWPSTAVLKRWRGLMAFVLVLAVEQNFLFSSGRFERDQQDDMGCKEESKLTKR